MHRAAARELPRRATPLGDSRHLGRCHGGLRGLAGNLDQHIARMNLVAIVDDQMGTGRQEVTPELVLPIADEDRRCVRMLVFTPQNMKVAIACCAKRPCRTMILSAESVLPEW